MQFLSGFESTHIFGSGTDVLKTTKHTEYYQSDLKLADSCGMKTLRYSAPWHSIERTKGRFDWSWLDRALGEMQSLGIDPIIDPLHHTSFPEWLEGGFANPEFSTHYLRFVSALAERYPWIRNYTVINEPFVTTWFCGHEAQWYPYFRGDSAFVPMLINVVDAIISVSRMLTANIPDVRLIHVDAAEKHRAVDSESQAHTDKHNHLRFLVQDLTLGKVDQEHYLYEYLISNGAPADQLAMFRSEPARIDVLGLDYYSHCELEWGREGRIYPNQSPEGLVPTAVEYAERYHLPVMLTETNIRGFVSDRQSWLKFMVEQCEQIEIETNARGLTFEGFCWYPFIDSTDWCSLVCEANGSIDPQGIIYLDQSLRRNRSELSEVFTSLAKGEIGSAEIPAYRFQKPLSDQLKAFSPFMSHWEWKETSSRPATRLHVVPRTQPSAGNTLANHVLAHKQTGRAPIRTASSGGIRGR